MKSILNTTFLATMFLATQMFLAPSACAEEHHGYAHNVGEKFVMGVANIATGWLEIPKSIINITNKSNLIYGVGGGLVQGVVNTVGRTVSGTIDVITFPLPTKPVPSPNYIWEDFDTDTSYNEIFRLRDSS